MNGFEVQTMNKGDNNMYSIHFHEGKTYLRKKASRIILSVNEIVRINGRNGKVINVQEMLENRYFVFGGFE